MAMSDKQVIEQLKKNEVILRKELEETKKELANKVAMIDNLMGTGREDRPTEEIAVTTANQETEEMQVENGIATELAASLEADLMERVADMERSIIENRREIAQHSQTLGLITRRMEETDHQDSETATGSMRVTTDAVSTLLTGLEEIAEAREAVLNNESGETPHCVKALMAIRLWELENLTAEEYVAREADYTNIYGKWTSNPTFSESEITLRMNTGKILPLVEEKSITLNPTVHARLVEQITSMMSFDSVHLEDLKRDDSCSDFIWPKIEHSLVTELVISAKSQNERLCKFIAQFRFLKSLTLNCDNGPEAHFITSEYLKDFAVLYKTSDERTKQMLKAFTQKCEKMVTTSVYISPTSIKAIEEHLLYMLNREADPSIPQFSEILLTVSKKNKAVYDVIAEKLGLERFKVIVNRMDDDSNAVEMMYLWLDEDMGPGTLHLHSSE